MKMELDHYLIKQSVWQQLSGAEKMDLCVWKVRIKNKFALFSYLILANKLNDKFSNK